MGEIYVTVRGHAKGQYFKSEQGQFCRPFHVDKIEKIDGPEGKENEKAIRGKIQDDRYVMLFRYGGYITDTAILMQDDRDIVPKLRISGELELNYDKTYYMLKIKELEVLSRPHGIIDKIKSTLRTQ